MVVDARGQRHFVRELYDLVELQRLVGVHRRAAADGHSGQRRRHVRPVDGVDLELQRATRRVDLLRSRYVEPQACRISDHFVYVDELVCGPWMLPGECRDLAPYDHEAGKAGRGIFDLEPFPDGCE